MAWHDQSGIKLPLKGARATLSLVGHFSPITSTTYDKNVNAQLEPNVEENKRNESVYNTKQITTSTIL